MTTFKHSDECHACGEELGWDLFLTYGIAFCPPCADKRPLDSRLRVWYTFLARILGRIFNRKRKR